MWPPEAKDGSGGSARIGPAVFKRRLDDRAQNHPAIRDERHDEAQHELLVSLRNQGRLETSSWLQHGRLGFNYRLDDVSAALGIGQLEKLDRMLAARRSVAADFGSLARTSVRPVTAIPR